MEDEQGGIHADSTDIAGNDIQLLLEWRDFLWLGLDRGEDLSLGSELADDDREEPALSLLNLGSGQEHW